MNSAKLRYQRQYISNGDPDMSEEVQEAAKHYWPAGSCMDERGFRLPDGRVIVFDDSIPSAARDFSLINSFGECPAYKAKIEARAQAQEQHQRDEMTLVKSNTAPVAMPRYDIDRLCAQPSQFMPNVTQQAFNMCRNSEQGSYDELKFAWPHMSGGPQTYCINTTNAHWQRYPYQFLAKCLASAEDYRAKMRFAEDSEPFRY
jgi:hypothetical protein